MTSEEPIHEGPCPACDGADRPEDRALAAAIRQYGDPVLRQKAKSVRRINAGVRELAARMAEVMYAARGAGLAATQIGELRRLAVLDVGEGLITLINPRLVHGEGTQTDVEACLSVVGLCGEVERYHKVLVKALDLEGKEVTVEGEGYLARALQHELDHLDGLLFVDRALSVTSTQPEQPAGADDERVEE